MPAVITNHYTEEQEQAARFANALAHPVRIAILQLPNNQTCCYHGNMADELPIAKSTLSQHLNELKDAELIQGNITPPTVRYCINRDKWNLAIRLLSGVLPQNLEPNVAIVVNPEQLINKEIVP
ncbi:ArsR/SmtB family transcription factor [Flavobacterium aquiphilum]|uniref:ArsR/SmtB family transcription factor n=1 Tax=Flavobacterium aquiphilum TaxID=3003261 RepID=UPI0024808B79|nr:winged helix-turn-helix domain-containing protein [Flavobacterium aquiphilum]